MKHAARALVAAAAVWCLSAGGAAACRYISPPSAEAELARVDTLFVGRAEKATQVSVGRQAFVETRFRVSRTLKGKPSAIRIVRAPAGSSCHPQYRIGQVYTVPATMVRGGSYLLPGNQHFPLSDYERAAGRRR